MFSMWANTHAKFVGHICVIRQKCCLFLSTCIKHDFNWNVGYNHIANDYFLNLASMYMLKIFIHVVCISLDMLYAMQLR